MTSGLVPTTTMISRASRGKGRDVSDILGSESIEDEERAHGERATFRDLMEKGKRKFKERNVIERSRPRSDKRVASISIRFYPFVFPTFGGTVSNMAMA